MALPHGFKSKANRIAVGLRSQMGLAASAPINIRSLARQLGISVLCLTEFEDWCPKQVVHLVERDREVFSALLISMGGNGRLIIVNDAHSIGRQNASIAHEIGHALLAHPLEDLSARVNCQEFDGEFEEEANFLSGCIMITNEAARHIVWSKTERYSAQRMYGVSRKMLEYRLNISGALIQFRRSRR